MTTVTVTGATSEQLIEADLEAGAITEEEALTYRVFAAFDDSRLPSRYFGDDSFATESDALNRLSDKFGSLSEEAQEVLGPFLVAPFEPGSWFQPYLVPGGAPPRASRPQAAEIRPCDDFAGTEGTRYLPWESLDAVEGKVKIWWVAGTDDTSKPIAEHMKAELESVIWPKVTSLMGREPLPDGGAAGICRGGTDALDITILPLDIRWMTGMLADADQALCSNLPARMLVNQSDYADKKRFDQLLAHETFHAVQYAFKTQECLKAGSPAMWWVEASAQWFEDHAYPTHNTEHHFASYLLAEPQRSLDQPGGSLGTESFYGSYLFPFFLARTGKPMAVSQIWREMLGSPVMTALTSPFADSKAWADNWHAFARANWNQGPIGDYKKWDVLTKKATAIDGPTIPAGPLQPRLNVTVEHLAAKYLRITPARGVTEIEVKNELSGDPNAGVQAVVTYDDGSYDEVDLTGKAEGSICIDDGTKKATEVVLIFSNANPSTPMIFKPGLEGREVCGCPNAATTAPRRDSRDSRSDVRPLTEDLAQGTCKATANVTYTVTESIDDPKYRYDHEGTIGVTTKLKWNPEYESYEDDGSTYEYSAGGNDWYDRGPNDNCSNDTVEASWTDSGSGTFDEYSGPSGYIEPTTQTFELGPGGYHITRTQTTKVNCLGTSSTGGYDTDVIPHACPFGAFKFSWTFELSSETDRTQTYVANCSDERDIYGLSPGGGPMHVKVKVTGTITVTKN